MLLIIYLVGLAGMIIRPVLFTTLSPLSILLSAGVLMLFYDNSSVSFWRYALFLAVAGIAIELIGVQTGKIFGHYTYGHALGPRIKTVPLIIGINWMMLSLCTMSMVQQWVAPGIKASFLAAVLMVLLDFFIEPVTERYHYWYWEGHHVPLQNFIAWFILSFFFQQIGNLMEFERKNPMAIWIYVLQLVFFILLTTHHYYSDSLQ